MGGGNGSKRTPPSRGTSPGRFSLDDARGINDLIALGDGEARRVAHLSEVKQRFLVNANTSR